MQRWDVARRWRTHRVERATWDHRTLEHRQASAAAESASDFGIVDRDTGGPYGWQDNARGQRRAQQHLDAPRVQTHQIEGAGQWRALAPGTRFGLQQHPQVQGDARFFCLSVQHQARNNLDADVFDAREQLLGPAAIAVPSLPAALGRRQLGGRLSNHDPGPNWCLRSMGSTLRSG
ncbi:contractile injection system protein, VgrG/Pvc8 family [Stenotrophomonas sp. LARHCG68]